MSSPFSAVPLPQTKNVGGVKIPHDIGVVAVQSGLIAAAIGAGIGVIVSLARANTPQTARIPFITPNLPEYEDYALTLAKLFPCRSVDTELFDQIVLRADGLCAINRLVHSDPLAGTMTHLPYRALKLCEEINRGLSNFHTSCSRVLQENQSSIKMDLREKLKLGEYVEQINEMSRELYKDTDSKIKSLR
jgi:hypothetical protein